MVEFILQVEFYHFTQTELAVKRLTAMELQLQQRLQPWRCLRLWLCLWLWLWPKGMGCMLVSRLIDTF